MSNNHDLAPSLGADTPAPPRYGGDGQSTRFKVEGKAPNGVLIAYVLDFNAPQERWVNGEPPVLMEVALGNPMSVGSFAAELDLIHNTGYTPGAKNLAARMRGIRKAMGYSYP